MRWRCFTSRRVRLDTEFHGVKFRAGDTILLAPTLANHDPAVFDRPDELLLDELPAPDELPSIVASAGAPSLGVRV